MIRFIGSLQRKTVVLLKKAWLTTPLRSQAKTEIDVVQAEQSMRFVALAAGRWPLAGWTAAGSAAVFGTASEPLAVQPSSRWRYEAASL
jgi:hypothetical protein